MLSACDLSRRTEKTDEVLEPAEGLEGGGGLADYGWFHTGDIGIGSSCRFINDASASPSEVAPEDDSTCTKVAKGTVANMLSIKGQGKPARGRCLAEGLGWVDLADVEWVPEKTGAGVDAKFLKICGRSVPNSAAARLPLNETGCGRQEEACARAGPVGYPVGLVRRARGDAQAFEIVRPPTALVCCRATALSCCNETLTRCCRLRSVNDICVGFDGPAVWGGEEKDPGPPWVLAVVFPEPALLALPEAQRAETVLADFRRIADSKGAQ